MVLPSAENEWQLAQTGTFSITTRLRGSPMLRMRHMISGTALGRERLDDALLRLRRHQRNVAIEDGRAHRIGGGADPDAAARDLRAWSCTGKTCDRDSSRGRFRAFLDGLPSGRVRSPGMRVGLARGESRQLVRIGHAIRIDLAHLRPRAIRDGLDAGRAIGERNGDAPCRSRPGAIAPFEDRWRDLRREDRAIGRVVDYDARERSGFRVNSGGSSCAGADHSGNDRGSPSQWHDNTSIACLFVIGFGAEGEQIAWMNLPRNNWYRQNGSAADDNDAALVNTVAPPGGKPEF